MYDISILKNTDMEKARKELLAIYNEFVQDNQILAEITETEEKQTLDGICSFLQGLQLLITYTCNYGGEWGIAGCNLREEADRTRNEN